jgi:transcription initiation factor TFIIH subunit 4
MRLLAGPSHFTTIYQLDHQLHKPKTANSASEEENEAAPDAETWTLNGTTSSKQNGGQSASALTDEQQARAILSDLWDLGILSFDDHGFIELDASFADELYYALSGPSTTLQEMRHLDTSEDLSSKALIDFAKAKWEQLIAPLLRLAHNGRTFQIGKSSVSNAQLMRILQKSGLTNDEGTSLSTEGYSFMLSEIPKQVWVLANSFLTKELAAQHRADGISFLIFISTSLIPGKIYSSEDLTEVQKQLLRDWETFGLIKFVASGPKKLKRTVSSNKNKNGDGQSVESEYFTVTPLANAILESSSSAVHIGEWSSGIIVESNFYLYLYTNSSIMVALLELFAHINVRLPNMCVARLTRQSVRAAFKKGLHANHIIQYLRVNKHAAHNALQAANASSTVSNSRNSALALAQALASTTDVNDMETMFPTSKTSGLPEQVEDQLVLWEQERFRFEASRVIQWEFERDHDDPSWYFSVKKYASDLNALEWSDDKAMALSVKFCSQEAIVAFYRSLKAGSQ